MSLSTGATYGSVIARTLTLQRSRGLRNRSRVLRTADSPRSRSRIFRNDDENIIITVGSARVRERASERARDKGRANGRAREIPARGRVARCSLARSLGTGESISDSVYSLAWGEAEPDALRYFRRAGEKARDPRPSVRSRRDTTGPRIRGTVSEGWRTFRVVGLDGRKRGSGQGHGMALPFFFLRHRPRIARSLARSHATRSRRMRRGLPSLP